MVHTLQSVRKYSDFKVSESTRTEFGTYVGGLW